MSSYKMVVTTRPVDGREQEYNDWYNGIHLREVLQVIGVKSAQRFRLSRKVTPEPQPAPYLAIYEIETDDIDATVADLLERAEDGRIFVTDALAEERSCVVYEEVGPARQG